VSHKDELDFKVLGPHQWIAFGVRESEDSAEWLGEQGRPNVPRVLKGETDKHFVKNTAAALYPGDKLKVISEDGKQYLIRLPKKD